MTLDPSKTRRQEKGINIWKEHDYQGTLNYIMRFGKTRVIELVVQRTRSNHSDKKIILLVPTDIAYQNVKYIEKQYNVEVYTWNRFLNLHEAGSTFECYLFIIDEVHKFLTEKAIYVISKIKAPYKLALTGSSIDSTGKSSLRKLGLPIIDIITEEEAIEMNWITDYDEYNVAVNISESEKKKYKALNDNISNIAENFKGIFKLMNVAFKRKLFKNDYEVIQGCYCGFKVLDYSFKVLEFINPETMREIVAALMGYKKDKIIISEYVRKVQDTWNPTNIQDLAKSYIKSITVRNNYLKYNVNKVNAVISMSKVINRPTIIYNDSIDMIDQLYSQLTIPRVKYHSQIESMPMYYDNGTVITYLSGDKKGQVKMFGKTTLKHNAIESIKDGRALYLITGKSLSESLNLPNIEYIICTAGDTNSVTYDQRVSRGKTIDDNNNDKRCTIINLFIDDFYLNDEYVRSRDKEKLIMRQTNVKNVIWLDNVDDLFGTLKNNL